MADRLDSIEARLASIERRLSALEAGTVASGEEQARKAKRDDEGMGEESVSRVATHLGRVLLIFGGAYLLRAITDFGFLPTQAGIPVGIAYALIWLYMAYRFGVAESQRTVAMIYGGVSILLVMPILIEAVTRFELLSGPASAIALAVFCAMTLSVSALRDLRSIAWLTAAGGLAASLALVRASGAAVSFSLVLLFLGLSSLWLVYQRSWKGLQWLGAIGANMGVVLIAVMSLHEQFGVNPVASYFVGVILWCAYLVSFVLRTHLQGHEPGIFEALQALFASVVAFGAAMYVARTSAVYLTVVGAAAVLFAVVSYGLAFSPKTAAARGRSFYFYSTLGLALIIGGTVTLLPPGIAAIIWSLMAVSVAWLSGRQARVSMSLQGTALLIAAGIGSGALINTLHALIGDPAQVWPSLSIPQLMMGAAAVACLCIPVSQISDRWGRMAGLPQLIVLVIAVWVVGGQIVTILAPLLAGVPGEASDLGRLATLRTTVLAAASVTLALSSRYKRWPEARWLAYPVLVAVGVKLVFEDFPHGRPATLFIALALVGGALILVARLLPKRQARPAGA